MKKANQTKKTNDENIDVGLAYNLVFKVSIPMDEATIDKHTEIVVNHIVSGLEIASSQVKGIKLEQSMHYGTDPVRIPILERVDNG